ncbi:MAG: rod shape-determining protein MreC [Clostridia bacterium]|nr:rod shape-determining protein MreC [Clostridia bacterium]
MARDQDRHFSEGGNLENLDKDWLLPDEGEERRPAWAQRLEEQHASREETNEVPSAPRQGREKAEMSGNSASAAPESRQRAEEAWSREAQKVESSLNRPDLQEEGDGEKENRKSAKPKTAKKNNGRKKSRKKKRTGDDEDRKGFIRSLVIAGICVFLFLMVALMVVSNFVAHPLLNVPRKAVTTMITPVQRFFSGLTDSVAGYLRTLKIRGNIEYEYEQLTILLDDYANQIAENEELRRINESLYDLLDEQERNRSMNPVAATVIGTDTGNYFSTLTLDVGSNSGVEDYMAVVHNGGLVGVTYNVRPNESQVRCIINSDCTVAALVQSSRDQGSVKGTLGINGEPMCRMYYLPDNSLPRPGDVVVTSGVGLEFPKGIPIGYIRESTRGMEDNKSYVVLEPVVDFQHLEYVTVYRYKPTYAEPAQQRDSTSATLTLETLATPQPIPTWQVGGLSDFLFAPSATPNGEGMENTLEETPTPPPAPTATPRATATVDPNATPLPPNLEYQPADNSDTTPTPSPRPTFTPTPSPVPTPDPGAMTVEDDE